MKNNNNTSLNIIMYVLIGLIVVVGIIFFIPEKSTVPVTNNTEKKEEVVITFTTNDSNITLKKGETKEINYTLSGNYNINWFSSNNSVATVSSGVVTAVGSGSCNITGTVSVDGKVKSISIKVTVEKEKEEETPPPTPTKPQIEKLVISSSKLNVTIGESKKINYRIEPTDGEIKSLKWESADTSVATVDNDGNVKGIKEGSTTVTININETIIGKVTVKVSPNVSDIKINTYPRLTLKVGEQSRISASTVPENKTSITYKSSNENVLSVSSDGTITGKAQGSAKVTLSSGSITKTIDINVIPTKGVITGTGHVWGYKSMNEKTPKRADTAFFQKMANAGRGSLSGTTYTITSGNNKFIYYIDRSMLNANGTNIMVRIYYPENVDLSTANMLTYMGGDGERNFSGLFGEIEKDRSIGASAGILVLVAEGNYDKTAFDQKAGMYSTMFAQATIGHKSGKNSIAGFSTGGTKVMGSANLYSYDRVIVFSSYYNWATSAERVKGIEVMFYMPNGDHLYNQAKATLNDMKKAGYKNVTIVTNSNELTNLFGSTFLVINPGSLMTSAHVTKNVTESRMISYVND